MKFLKKVVIGILIFFLTNAALGWITFWTMGQIPDVLIQCILGTGTAELIMTAVIELAKPLIEAVIDKLVQKEKDEDIEFMK